MIIEEVKFKLKDGREAVLRSPKEEDVESTLKYLVISAGETDFILRYPEECGKYTPEGEKKLFEQKNASPNEAMIMCVVDGRVVGNCEISFFRGMKTRHRARHLYEKMGFRIAGVHPNAIRLKDGTLLNNYLMIKEVER